MEYQDAGSAVSSVGWEGISIWDVTSASESGRIDQIQLTAMRETLVTAQICPLNFYLSKKKFAIQLFVGKGQLILKWFFGVIDFLQKMN